jgi:microcystin-dependent protein
MSFPVWNADGSWNAFTSTYFKDTIDLSGDLYIRNGVIASPANEIQFDDAFSFINIPNNVHIFGEFKLLYNTVDYNVGYQLEQVASFSGALSQVTTDISNLQIQTTDISYDASNSITSIANKLSAYDISFNGSINSITPTVFGYLSGATSNLQSQITNISAVSTGVENNFSVQQRFSNNIRLDGSMIVSGNTITLTNNTLQNIQYLSTLSSNVQTQIDGITTKLTNVEYIDSTTEISGDVYLYDIVTFETSINAITPTTFNYLLGVTDYIQEQFDAITPTLTAISYSPTTTTITGTTNTTTLTFSTSLNGISSATFGYLTGVTSNIQAQINGISSISLSSNNTFTGLNTFNGALGAFAIVQNFLQFTTGGASTWKNGSAGDNVFEMAIGGAQRGFTIQGGATSANKSCFGLYFQSSYLSLPSERRPIMYALDNGTDASNTLVISTGTTQLSNLNITGNMLTDNGNTTITNDTLNRLQYLTTLSSNVQDQINTVATKLTDISYSASTTTIANTLSSATLTFSGTLNTISTTVFGYLTGLTSNIQDQLTNLGYAVNPTGSIIMSPLSDIQTTSGNKYLLCNGQLVSRTTYATLFGKIGTTFGAGNGSTTFTLPNYQGLFFRGMGSQTINGTTYTGVAVNNAQQDTVQNHTHLPQSGSYLQTTNSSSSTGGYGAQFPATKPNTSNFDNTGLMASGRDDTNESRPVNVGIYYYIKT